MSPSTDKTHIEKEIMQSFAALIAAIGAARVWAAWENNSQMGILILHLTPQYPSTLNINQRKLCENLLHEMTRLCQIEKSIVWRRLQVES